ncbi:hypothetical protein ACT7CO_01080 [Bacillus pacificus]|jgi:hypothetical protein
MLSYKVIQYLKIILQKDTPTHNHSVGVSFLFKEEKGMGKTLFIAEKPKMANEIIKSL